MSKIFKYIALAGFAAVLLSCGRFDEKDNVFSNCVYLEVSANSSTQMATFSNNRPTVTESIVVTSAYPVDKDIKVTVAVDNALAEGYNASHGTSYETLPQKYLSFSSAEVTIPEGRTTANAVSVTLTGLMGDGDSQEGALTVDNTYLLPVRITASDMDVLESSSVAYYLVRRSSAITVAASLHDNWINFPLLDVAGSPQAAAYNGLTAVTYEALIYVDQFDLTNTFGTCNISTVMGVEQYLLLRIGDTNFEREQLQFDGSGSGTSFGKFPARDASKILYDGRWYHVAATYDYETRTARIYVNGKVQSEGTGLGTATGGINLAMRALGTADAYQFFIGKSYNNYRPLQGKIAEARVWRVARTPEEIWDNMYRIENPKSLPDLIGYWKFDEGSGNTIHDSSMYGNDGEAQYDIVWPSGIEIPEINKTEE